jgi:ketosteroid isomerase-like protein
VSGSDNAELVRRAFEAAGRRPEPDIETLVELFAVDHELTTDWGTGDNTTYRGLEGFRRAMADIAESWDDFRNEPEEIVDAGDGVVVIVVRASARGHASGTPVSRQVGVLARIRDGQIASTRYYPEPEEAFAAAGIARG